MSFKYKLFKEIFKMSSAAAQKASTKSFQIFSTFAVVDPTQTNPTHGSTQPMDNSAPDRRDGTMTAGRTDAQTC